MATEELGKMVEAYPMKGGDGPNGYAKNSSYQKGAAGAAQEVVNMEITEKLDVDSITLSNSNTFSIADLGCSVGPNTFSAVENIIDAVQLKYQNQGRRLNSQIPEFQVFFNDHTPNDFNILFKSLPPNRQYYATGVPGSFYGRLFPKASLHIVHSSFAIHWLSRVPKQVLDKNSPAWNKGRIHYLNSTYEVVRAFEAQYAEDMACFLDARAQEIVCGGLMVLIIPGRLQATHDSQSFRKMTHQLLGDCLMDLARKGVVTEEKVESFNIPIYYMSPTELEAAVERNGCFSVEGMENIRKVTKLGNVTESAQLISSHSRAVIEGLLSQQFGDEILDELFDLYRKKLEGNPSIFESMDANFFVTVLKRKAN
ncbi:hypothetical protein M0R45_031120 [Rubus argutus]|uniref:Uncharacterized protein n=1 Tax=Rubus argutus TaxID=59490 RepID=A0AAW1WHE4_RUBAR